MLSKTLKIFIEAAGSKVSENLKNLFLKFEPQANIEIIHPGKIEETSLAKQKIQSYDGIAFTGGAMRLNDMTDEIKKHIQFAKDCLESGKKFWQFAGDYKFVLLPQVVKLIKVARVHIWV